MAKCLQKLVVLCKLSLANVLSAIVIAVGSLINTTPINVLSINAGNSVDVTGIGVVVFFTVALLSHRDATSLVIKPDMEKGQELSPLPFLPRTFPWQQKSSEVPKGDSALYLLSQTLSTDWLSAQCESCMQKQYSCVG